MCMPINVNNRAAPTLSGWWEQGMPTGLCPEHPSGPTCAYCFQPSHSPFLWKFSVGDGDSVQVLSPFGIRILVGSEELSSEFSFLA